MSRVQYDGKAIYQQSQLPGNAGTTCLFTPQKGTGSETKTHTTTLKEFSFGGRSVKLKKLSYIVTTAQTGAGNNIVFDLYVNTTSKASLTVTTQTANAIVVSSSNIDETVGATSYIQIKGLATTTASDANAAVGQLSITYEENFVAD